MMGMVFRRFMHIHSDLLHGFALLLGIIYCATFSLRISQRSSICFQPFGAYGFPNLGILCGLRIWRKKWDREGKGGEGPGSSDLVNRNGLSQFKQRFKSE